MVKFSIGGSLREFQDIIGRIYGVPDDRLYSIWDLLSNQERFTMRALKGIRKGDKKKLNANLMISFSWLMALANRLHIGVDDAVWHRFPMLCSYCGRRPCICRKIHPGRRVPVIRKHSLRPHRLADFQKMFSTIYPPQSRTLAHAGVHLAEEMGEVSEVIHGYLGEHKHKQFEGVKNEVADFISCTFGVASSAKINVARELAKMYYRNCHVCHKAPCACTFSSVARFAS